MRIYVDLFFLFNVIMDLIIILGVSIILKRKTSYFRIVISSILGGLSSLLLFTSLNKLLIEIVSIVFMVIIAFGYKDIRYLFKNIFYMYILSILLGGLIYLFNIRVTNSVFFTYLIIIVISILVMVLYIKETRHLKNIYNNCYKVDIYFTDNDSISLTGFVDTGNNLYDPYKKRPIILVSSKYKRDGKFILVPYRTTSGDGLLKCIKPYNILIDGIPCKKNALISFLDSPILIDGVDVILHKDLMKG